MLVLLVVSRDTCIYDFSILLETQVFSKQDISYIAGPKRERIAFVKQFDLYSLKVVTVCYKKFQKVFSFFHILVSHFLRKKMLQIPKRKKKNKNNDNNNNANVNNNHNVC